MLPQRFEALEPGLDNHLDRGGRGATVRAPFMTLQEQQAMWAKARKALRDEENERKRALVDAAAPSQQEHAAEPAAAQTEEPKQEEDQAPIGTPPGKEDDEAIHQHAAAVQGDPEQNLDGQPSDRNAEAEAVVGGGGAGAPSRQDNEEDEEKGLKEEGEEEQQVSHQPESVAAPKPKEKPAAALAVGGKAAQAKQPAAKPNVVAPKTKAPSK